LIGQSCIFNGRERCFIVESLSFSGRKQFFIDGKPSFIGSFLRRSGLAGRGAGFYGGRGREARGRVPPPDRCPQRARGVCGRPCTTRRLKTASGSWHPAPLPSMKGLGEGSSGHRCRDDPSRRFSSQPRSAPGKRAGRQWSRHRRGCRRPDHHRCRDRPRHSLPQSRSGNRAGRRW